MFEFFIVAIIALAVWLYVHFTKKKAEATATPTPSATVSEKKKPEPEPEVKEQHDPVAHEAMSVEPVIENEKVDVVPEDSTLRRHYLQNLAAQAASSFDKEEVIVKEEVKPVVSKEGVTEIPAAPISRMPEDVVLKRHRIQQLVAETEAEMPPRPTDSMLRRHYDTHLLSVVMSRLDALR